MWRNHSVRNALAVALIGTALLIFTSSAIGPFLFPMSPGSDEVQSDVSTINTLAQVTGAIFGMLLAVVTFTVALRAQREDDSSALLPFVAHRYGMFLISGVVVAVAAADGIIPILMPWVHHGALRLLLLLNVPLVPITLVLALWLVCRVIQDAGTSNLANTLPVFKARMHVLALQDVRHALLIKAYSKALEACGIEYNGMSEYLSRLRKERRQVFHLKQRGNVVDVDLCALRALALVVKPLAAHFSAQISVRPGESLDAASCLVLQERQTLQPRGNTAVPGGDPPLPVRDATLTLPAGASRAIRRAFDGFFISRRGQRTTPTELRQFFERFETSLTGLARDGRSIQIVKKLADYEQLLTAWLDIAPLGTTGRVPFFFMDTTSGFAGPLEIDMFGVLRAGASSSDNETFRAIVDALVTSLFAARRAEQLRLYADFAHMLSFAFYLGMRHETLRPTIGSAFDSAMHAILTDFKCRARGSLPGDVDDPQHVFERERPYLDVALTLSMSVIRTAMEEGDAKHAGFLFYRLVEHERYTARRPDRNARAPSTETVDTLHDYAVLAIGAWALHLLESAHAASTEAARAVLGAALTHLNEREEVVALWELYHARATFEAAIDSRLNLTTWDLQDRTEMRVGIPVTSTSGGEWRVRGLYAALLRGASAPPWKAGPFFAAAPPRHMWSANTIEKSLKQLVTGGHLGIPADKHAEAISAVKSLVQARQDAGDAAYAHRAATEPLDKERCDKLKQDIVQSVDSHRDWIRAIVAMGGRARRANHASPLVLELPRYIPRDYLIPANSWGSGFGDFLGEEAAAYEAMWLIALAEQLAGRSEPIKALAELPERVRDARAALVTRGYEPNLLILPQDERFAAALFQKPLWQVPERKEFGAISFGTWEGLHVLKYPYSNPTSITIADAKSLFGTITDVPGRVDVTFRELTATEVVEWSEALTRRGGEQAKTRNQPQIMVLVRVYPTIGVASATAEEAPGAALALDISDSDGGYAMLPGDKLYHRPSCGELLDEPEVRYSLQRRLKGDTDDRQPCPQCRPDMWNVEARSNVIK